MTYIVSGGALNSTHSLTHSHVTIHNTAVVELRTNTILKSARSRLPEKQLTWPQGADTHQSVVVYRKTDLAQFGGPQGPHITGRDVSGRLRRSKRQYHRVGATFAFSVSDVNDHGSGHSLLTQFLDDLLDVAAGDVP